MALTREQRNHYARQRRAATKGLLAMGLTPKWQRISTHRATHSTHALLPPGLTADMLPQGPWQWQCNNTSWDYYTNAVLVYAPLPEHARETALLARVATQWGYTTEYSGPTYCYLRGNPVVGTEAALADAYTEAGGTARITLHGYGLGNGWCGLHLAY